MKITDQIGVDAPLERVWAYLNDVPNLAPCLPGAELIGEDGNGNYDGKVAARLGPVKLNFTGKARIVESDEVRRRLVLHAAGSEDKGKGTADMLLTATLASAGTGTTMKVEQDMTISGAAAQFGRGMIADVMGVIMREFADNIAFAINQGAGGGTATLVRRQARPASGFAIGLRAARMALMRVFARFFLPYDRNR